MRTAWICLVSLTIALVFSGLLLSTAPAEDSAKPTPARRIQRLEAAVEYLLGTGWEQHADKGAAGIKAHEDAELAEYAKKLKAEREAK